MYGFIYQTTNLVNGKKYIGSSRYGKRGWETYLGSGKLLKKAVSKYGAKSFKREILAEAETKEALIELENHYLEKFNVQEDRGFYNLQGRAYATKGFSGKTHSKERNELVSALLKGKKRPKEVVDKFSKALTGRSLSEEHKAKVGAAGKKAYANRESLHTVDGLEFITLDDIMAHYGVTIYYARKFVKDGKSSQPKKGTSKRIEFDGVVYESAIHASKETGIPPHAIRRRGKLI